MSTDRYTKAILTIIAVALCVIAFPRPETPEVVAASLRPDAEKMATVYPAPNAGEPKNRHSSAAGPLRWRIPYALEVFSGGSAGYQCHTAVSILNASSAAVDVEVVLFDSAGVVEASALRNLPVDDSLVYTSATPEETNMPFPFGIEAEMVLQSASILTNGFALVYAEDPRVLVTAFVSCVGTLQPSLGEAFRGITNIPAYPVGATMEYFQAGTSPVWTPPMAMPETP
jgi:hypothetical protein